MDTTARCCPKVSAAVVAQQSFEEHLNQHFFVVGTGVRNKFSCYSDDVKIGVIFAFSPLQVQNHSH